MTRKEKIAMIISTPSNKITNKHTKPNFKELTCIQLNHKTQGVPKSSLKAWDMFCDAFTSATENDTRIKNKEIYPMLESPYYLELAHELEAKNLTPSWLQQSKLGIHTGPIPNRHSFFLCTGKEREATEAMLSIWRHGAYIIGTLWEMLSSAKNLQWVFDESLEYIYMSARINQMFEQRFHHTVLPPEFKVKELASLSELPKILRAMR